MVLPCGHLFGGNVARRRLLVHSALDDDAAHAAGQQPHGDLPGAGRCPGDTASIEVAVEQGFQLRADTTICYGDTLQLQVPAGLADWFGTTSIPAVTTPKGFREAYKQYAEGGWPALPFEAEWGSWQPPQ